MFSMAIRSFFGLRFLNAADTVTEIKRKNRYIPFGLMPDFDGIAVPLG